MPKELAYMRSPAFLSFDFVYYCPGGVFIAQLCGLDETPTLREFQTFLKKAAYFLAMTHTLGLAMTYAW
jgi:hypothetical protein